VAYGASKKVLPAATPGSLRGLFIWHAFDALIHFFLEGSYLYHCFFTTAPAASLGKGGFWHPTPTNFLGNPEWAATAYGPQAGGANPLAQLWMVYARADRRWAGADLVSIFFFRGRCGSPARKTPKLGCRGMREFSAAAAGGTGPDGTLTTCAHRESSASSS